jgi:two-component system, response regulator RegA
VGRAAFTGWSRIAMTNAITGVADGAKDSTKTSVMTAATASTVSGERTLLIVEDDKSFLQRLARAMETRGFVVSTAESVADGLLQVEKAAPAFAVVDMRLGDGNGLDVISAMKKRRPEARAIILTGYGNIATAVNAVKLGAVDYLAKPVDADDVAAALLALDNKKIEPPENPMSADRVRWEHIQRIYELCGRNVSETARRLNMHRRTLQRILAKRAPK